MPRGAYALADPVHGTPLALERFTCTTGPAGWRYTSEVFDPAGEVLLGGVDLACDSRWRQTRVDVRSGSWRLRGGTSGPDVLFTRHPADASPGSRDVEVDQVERARLLTGRSPAFAVTAARLLALEPGARSRVTALAVTEPVLATRVVAQTWALVDVTDHETGGGEALRVERYDVVDLDTGDHRTVHLTGDVLLDAPGAELVDLDGRPGA